MASSFNSNVLWMGTWKLLKSWSEQAWNLASKSIPSIIFWASYFMWKNVLCTTCLQLRSLSSLVSSRWGLSMMFSTSCTIIKFFSVFKSDSSTKFLSKESVIKSLSSDSILVVRLMMWSNSSITYINFLATANITYLPCKSSSVFSVFIFQAFWWVLQPGHFWHKPLLLFSVERI